MKKFLRLAVLGTISTGSVAAQTDTVIQPHPKYNTVSRTHRRFFGENYRKEWATPVTLPFIKISEKGLKPTELGGGKQTKSLRLEDAQGKEWVIRSIEKNPEILLPEPWRQTFAKDWLLDAMSAEHPFAPLMIPVLADAVQVPHTNPIIGVIAPDKALGEFEKTFANTICMLEEREPLGESDNTDKMLEKMDEDNDNRLDTLTFFRARILDLFIGDWDRHNDQWRWADNKDGDGKLYIPVPRDRDQAFYRSEGYVPALASRKWIAPFLTGFQSTIKRGNHFFINGRELNGRFLSQLTYEQWMNETRAFIAHLSDSVLEAALRKLPEPIYQVRHDELLRILKERRGHLEKAMEEYYHFFNRIVDIKLTDKKEVVEITEGENGGTQVTVPGLFSRNFTPDDTRELRIYLGDGKDSVVVNTPNSKIKTRLIGGEGKQVYRVEAAEKRPYVYDNRKDYELFGKWKKRISNDSLNTAYVPTNLYNVVFPLLTAGFNIDDGFLFGAGFRYVRKRGFRKLPYAEVQQLTAAYSFSTGAVRVR